MQASRVTFSPEIRAAMSSPMLDWKKKRNLKIERVKAYIRSKPAGHKFKMQELIAAAGYNATDNKGYTAGYAFVKGLGDSRILDIEDTKKYRKTVSIRNDETVTVTKPEEKVAEDKSPETAPEAQKMVHEDEPHIVSVDVDVRLVREIERLAKQFSWKNDSNDLREFVRSLK